MIQKIKCFIANKFNIKCLHDFEYRFEERYDPNTRDGLHVIDLGIEYSKCKCCGEIFCSTTPFAFYDKNSRENNK